jgi:hypothetical protein
MVTTFHIRERLRPRGGSQWYKDRSERPVNTFCGAEPTAYDIAWADRNRAANFEHPEKGTFVPCSNCVGVNHGRNK